MFVQQNCCHKTAPPTHSPAVIITLREPCWSLGRASTASLTNEYSQSHAGNATHLPLPGWNPSSKPACSLLSTVGVPRQILNTGIFLNTVQSRRGRKARPCTSRLGRVFSIPLPALQVIMTRLTRVLTQTAVLLVYLFLLYRAYPRIPHSARCHSITALMRRPAAASWLAALAGLAGAPMPPKRRALYCSRLPRTG